VVVAGTAIATIVAGSLLATRELTRETPRVATAVRVAVMPLRLGETSATSAAAKLISVDLTRSNRSGAQGQNVEIAGGTDVQRQLLADILARFPEVSLARVTIVPKIEGAETGVGLAIEGSGADPMLSDWEGMLLAGAFRDLSALRGLPHVLGLPPRAPVAPQASAEAAAALTARVRAAAAAAGSDVDWLLIYRPEGLAPAVVLRASDPASFLAHRLPAFLEALGDRWRDYDGTFVEVVDAKGAFVWASATNPLTSHGSVGTRPDLLGCGPIGNLFSTPPPCPVH
jgi:hypothetical protein